MSTKTADYGAAQLAAGVRRKIRRMMKDFDRECEQAAVQALERLDAWVANWDKRAAKRKGGLGRKGAAK